MDHGLFHLIDGRPGGALARFCLTILLRVCSGGLLWFCLFALAFAGGGRRGRRLALTGSLAVLLAHAIGVWGLLGLVQRPLPVEVLAGVHVLTSLPAPAFAFPATRTAQAFAALPFLVRGEGAGPAAVWVLALLTAYAEVYTGAHFPTDAIGGALLGLFCAALAVWLLGSPFRPRSGQLLPLPRRLHTGQRRA